MSKSSIGNRGTHRGTHRGTSKGVYGSRSLEILRLFVNEGLTPTQIRIRLKLRSKDNSYVNRVLRKFRNDGIIPCPDKGVPETLPTRGLPEYLGQKIRLHGQEFNIKILYKDQRYKNILNKSNLLYVDGNTIRLYRDSIEVYSAQSFYAEDVQKCYTDSVSYFQRLFMRIENDLKIIIIKSRKSNIKEVSRHFAWIHNGIAKECRNTGDKIRIYTKDDGKLWFLIDNSFNLDEAETVHPVTSKSDMQLALEPFFNDLRDNNAGITMSHVLEAIKQISEQHKETATALNAIVQLMKPAISTNTSQEVPDYVG